MGDLTKYAKIESPHSLKELTKKSKYYKQKVKEFPISELRLMPRNSNLDYNIVL
jgi:hypothetical protein